MDNSEAVKLLSALAQDTRVSIFEILSREKDSGVSAGIISTTIGASPSCISFHLKELARVGLIQGKPLGRHIIYSANFDKAAELANFILERCCSEDAVDQQEISCA